MTPEALEELVNRSIETMMQRGFQLRIRSFGDTQAGCALTAAYLNTLFPAEVEQQMVSSLPADVFHHFLHELSDAQIDAFMAGFDHLFNINEPHEKAYALAGIRVRLCWQNLIDDSPEG